MKQVTELGYKDEKTKKVEYQKKSWADGKKQLARTWLKIKSLLVKVKMIHKISDFCLKIDGLKKTSDRLYNLKYNNPKTPERDAQVQELD